MSWAPVREHSVATYRITTNLPTGLRPGGPALVAESGTLTSMSISLRRVLTGLAASGGALVGGLVLANRALLLDDLPPTLPGAMHDWIWRGWRVRYTVMGDGPPVVLVHGVHAAASSFEMRNVFEPLSQRHTVYAIDLLGFGKSERPAARYTGHLFADLLVAFLDEVVRQPAILVGSSLSAAFAVAAARVRPELVGGLVLLSPTGVTNTGPLTRAFGRLLSVPLIGTAAFNLLVSRASIGSYLRRAYADTSLVDEPLIGQQWATSHQPNARLAPAAFVSGRLDLPFTGSLGSRTAPILAIRGSVPGVGAQASDAELRALSDDVTVETIAGAGQLPHDEAADRVVDILESWLARPA
jgi:pimeloyl-ACP methyl ester carboxylesterase